MGEPRLRPVAVTGRAHRSTEAGRSISSMKILVRAATALGRSARKQRNRFGTEITHCRTGARGMTRSTRCGAVCAIRRPLQEGQTPRPLHGKATTKPCPHDVQLARPNPKQRMPQVRYDRSSRSTCAETGCSATARVSSQPSRCSATILRAASSPAGVARSGGNSQWRCAGELWTASVTQSGRRPWAHRGMDEGSGRMHTSAATRPMRATLTRATLLNRCLNPRDVSVREARGARPLGARAGPAGVVAHHPADHRPGRRRGFRSETGRAGEEPV